MKNHVVIPVILCGGSGTRLWPASREKLPKQFLRLTSDLSLLQDTLRRALAISGARPDQAVCVTLGALRNEVDHQLREIDQAAARHIICEPNARNTAAAVAYAALYVARHFGPDAVMWILPADHHIADEAALTASLRKALDIAGSDHLITFGINPTRPDTGYGYIRRGAKLQGHDDIRIAEAFVEKPDLATARQYLESGDYLWNSGMFLFRSAAVLDHYRRLASDILDAVSRATANGHEEASPSVYAQIPEQPFDKAIMEKSDRVAVVPCNPGWSDVGSWESLWEISSKDDNGNAIRGPAACIGTRDSLIHAQGRLVACAGLDNVIIAETHDAILVADRRNGDAIRELVKSLKKAGNREVESAPVQIRPWGIMKTVADFHTYRVKEISIKAGRKMVPEFEGGNAAFWTVIEGQGILYDGQASRPLHGRSITRFSANDDKYIENTGIETLKVVQMEYNASPSSFLEEDNAASERAAGYFPGLPQPASVQRAG